MDLKNRRREIITIYVSIKIKINFMQCIKLIITSSKKKNKGNNCSYNP